jgi:hypothetical protein
VKSFAASMLLLGVLRHYGWEIVRPEWQAHVWNISGAATILVFLWSFAWRWRVTTLIALWWSFEEMQVIVCSLGWLYRPWPVLPGQAQCSALIGFDLSSVGLLCVAAILTLSTVNSYRAKGQKKRAP